MKLCPSLQNHSSKNMSVFYYAHVVILNCIPYMSPNNEKTDKSVSSTLTATLHCDKTKSY